jgi:hypothetical protein
MAKSGSIALIVGVMAVLGAAVALGSAPALAQDAKNGAEAYRDGDMLGRTLHDPRECGGSGEYHGGCVDGVQESEFDREADEAIRSGTFDAKPSGRAPLLAPPPGLFQDPYSKPGESQPPNE